MCDARPEQAAHPVNTVAIVVDESSFGETERLVEQLASNGIERKNIFLLAYREKAGKAAQNSLKIFDLSAFDWKGHIVDPMVKAFTERRYDLLINYYDFEKAALIGVSVETPASFKVGFPTTDRRLNHFTIGAPLQEYGVFTSELFKYLRILNKI